MIETIVALPKGYDQRCSCVLNDEDLVVGCRNVIMLLIMMLLPKDIAVELVLHVWYSARLTSDMVKLLHESIRPTIAEFVDEIVDQPDNKFLRKTCNFESSHVTVQFMKGQWKFVLAMLEKCHDIDKTEKSRMELMLHKERLDDRERILFAMPPSRRVAASRMRQEGILLPFGSCLEEFKFPNP